MIIIRRILGNRFSRMVNYTILMLFGRRVSSLFDTRKYDLYEFMWNYQFLNVYFNCLRLQFEKITDYLLNINNYYAFLLQVSIIH